MAEITLLIPCFNAGAFLPRLQLSLHALTRPFTKVLCYDDGSTDDTIAVARKLGIEIITGESNRGVAVARNRLAAAARTEWIHFHDADDLLAPGFVERLTPWCSASHDVVTCDADWLDASSGTVVIAWRYDAAALAGNTHCYLLGQGMSLNNSVIRRQSWADIGGCDETLAMWEDADVHIRLARAGARFHHVPEVLAHALRRGDSLSHDYRRSWRARLTALENYAAAGHEGNVHATLARESEIAASQLALLGDAEGTQRAIALCRQLGGNPPSSRNPVIRLLKPIVPAALLLRWQARRRNPGFASLPFAPS